MKNYYNVLKHCALFNEVQEKDFPVMLKCLNAKNVNFKKGQAVFNEGETAKYIGIVISGAVQVERVDYFGNRSILAGVEPSQMFGESFAFADVKLLPVSVVAVVDSEIMLIDAMKITEPCSNSCDFHSRIIYNLLKIAATKNIMFNRKIEITSKRTTREKLMTYLFFQAKSCGKNSFTIPFDRQALADYLEVDRSGLSAEISKMRREGILSCQKNHFTLI